MSTIQRLMHRLSAATMLAGTLTVLSVAPAVAVETACVASSGTNCAALIPDGPQPGVSSTLTVPAGVCGAASPTGVSVRVNLTHSWIGDLTIAVKNPANQTVTLLNSLAGAPSVSCAGDDINATFQDGGAAASCNAATVPSLSGTVAPATALAPLAASAAGTWTLTVTDNMNGNNGAINDWAVDVSCVQLPPADMAVALSGFPAQGMPGTNVTGTVTCTNVGGQPAANVTCSVVGGTASACVLQPANTPVAAFPVASVAAGQSISCSVSTLVGPTGQINVTGQTSAGNDSNAANNAVAYAANGQLTIPTLSESLMAVLALLLAITAIVSLRTRRL